ncbi:AraC family transcriptional regulator [Cohnella sp. OV330]|uniref:AraC family transcriptional regulator n=1 Tax=Cohnella sp. OV330 TaxID=1855288 RepID=UPI0008E84544|nr:AraC family transcriptional regulator [Cohnella sp. OV330]SFB54023.1 AraC family transcriptional regulator [Cohnella sp. OV330]
MNGLDRLNDGLAYLEAHLADEEAPDIAEAARRACCGEHHFRRMFASLADVTLTEYVRRRRLTLAAFELIGSEARILDIAVKYGYGTADSFARAFQAMHGLAPSEARRLGRPLKAYPRMTFRLTIEGGDEMKYRLVEKEAFRIVGVMKRVPLIYEGVNPHIAELWSRLTGELIAELKGLSDVEPAGLISASANFSEGRKDGGEVDQYIGAATTRECPSHLAALEVAASEWAVFEAVGAFPSALQSVWGRIYAEWFPSSSYELAPGPELLWNEGQDTSKPDYRSEIWIPVRRRQ